jgi:hypothetical protein
LREKRKINDPEWWVNEQEKARIYASTYVDPDPERTRARIRVHRENNIEKIRTYHREYARNTFKRALRHHVKQERYERMSLAQGGICAITVCDSTGTKHGLDVDHDHSHCSGNTSCGECVRGLVCNPHNIAMGLLKDSWEKALGLIEYLENGYSTIQQARAWVEEHPSPLIKGGPRNRSFKRNNINQAIYNAMLVMQGGGCGNPACQKPPSPKRRLDIDHNHDHCNTGVYSCGECIRGLLCGSCNKALGLLRDDPITIRAVADYLRAEGFQYE